MRHFLRHIDYVLLLAALALTACGVTIIYYATRYDGLGSAWYYAQRQIIFAGVGLVAMIVVSVIDYERFRRWQWALYGFAVLSIAVVFFLGPLTRGSRRWINLGFFPFQPSALAIFLIAVGLAAFLVDRLELLSTKKLTLMALAYVAVPALLVFREPDLGTATVLIVLGIALLFFFGTRWTHFLTIGLGIVALAVLALVVLPAMGVHVVQDYQMARLTVFLDPGKDPGASGYNLTQALIAVGSGGLTGRGELATQTSLQFLPEHHTDFIFAVAGETWGFVGAAGLIVLYAILIWRALRIATLSRDMYGSVMAGGIAAMWGYQVLVSAGMSIGIMPITGIPLPFVSYSGAAIITNLMLIGLLESIHIRGGAALSVRDKVLTV